jgi:hypothetical protein
MVVNRGIRILNRANLLISFCSLYFFTSLCSSVTHFSPRRLTRFEFSQLLKLLVVILIVPWITNFYCYLLYDQALKKKVTPGIPKKEEEDDKTVNENYFDCDTTRSRITDAETVEERIRIPFILNDE